VSIRRLNAGKARGVTQDRQHRSVRIFTFNLNLNLGFLYYKNMIAGFDVLALLTALGLTPAPTTPPNNS
jgi:hypothetical protein